VKSKPGPWARILYETFGKCPILFKAKEGDNFNHRNTIEYFED
jgi:hypothetical protein